jgi:hypothetical protein
MFEGYEFVLITLLYLNCMHTGLYSIADRRYATIHNTNILNPSPSESKCTCITIGARQSERLISTANTTNL